MGNQTAANPTTAIDEHATILVAMELSLKSWLVAISDPLGSRVSKYSVRPGDSAKVLELIEKRISKVHRVLQEPVQVVSCYEAGYEGFWLHRVLDAAGVKNVVIDPASLLVNRRARQRKTDRIDLHRLLRALRAHLRGDKEDSFSVVQVPSVEQEDSKRPNREHDRLIKERNGHTNRIKALLVLQGIYWTRPQSRGFRATLGELRCADNSPLPAHVKAEIDRDLDRLELIERHLALVDNQRRTAIVGPAERGSTKHMIQALTRLKGLDLEGPTVLVNEVFYRGFNNRREIASYVGFDGTPFDSGGSRREQGISKAGNPRARKVMNQLAWLWLRYQPGSALSKWFRERVGDAKGRLRRIMIVALARKLLIALWRFATEGLIPEGAVFTS